MKQIIALCALLFCTQLHAITIDISSTLNSKLRNALASYKARKQLVDYIYFHGTQGVVVSRKNVVCSNPKHFDSNGPGPKNLCINLKNKVAASGYLQALGVDAANDYVIVTRKEVYYSNPTKFKNIGVKAAIDYFKNKNKNVNSVAFFPNGGWVVIAQGDYKYKNLPLRLREGLEAAKWGEQHITRVYSQPWKGNDSKWLLVAGHDYWTNIINPKIHNSLKTMIKNRNRINLVSFGTKDWVTYSHYRDVFLGNDHFSKLEYDLNTNANIWDRMEFHRVPGVSISIVDGDKIISRSYGVTNVNTGNKATAHSYFPSASMSKAVFSYGIALAEQKRLLRLKDEIQEYVTDYPNELIAKWYNSLPATRDKPYRLMVDRIKLDHLLSHSGGLSVHGIGVYKKSDNMTLENLIMGQKGRNKVIPLEWYGYNYKYSGGGYSLVESILESATGMNASRWLGENVLIPLGMNRSTFGNLHPSREMNMARGHQSDLKPEPLMYCPGKGAGGLVSTSRDYAKFLWSLMNEGKSYTTKKNVLFLSNLRKLFTPMGSRDSSNAFCNSSSPCARTAEICVATKCVNPISTSANWFGLGINHQKRTRWTQERGVLINYPTMSRHGGAQTGIRNHFYLRYHLDKAIVIYTNGVDSWTDGLGNTRGASSLISELYWAFSRAYNF